MPVGSLRRPCVRGVGAAMSYSPPHHRRFDTLPAAGMLAHVLHPPIASRRTVVSANVFRQTYPFELPDLPYAYEALEPHIDAATLRIHHRKHHATYVEKLNEALS